MKITIDVDDSYFDESDFKEDIIKKRVAHEVEESAKIFMHNIGIDLKEIAELEIKKIFDLKIKQKIDDIVKNKKVIIPSSYGNISLNKPITIEEFILNKLASLIANSRIELSWVKDKVDTLINEIKKQK